MFDQIFRRPGARVRHCTAPLAEERERFLRHLAEQGWSRKALYGVAIELKVVVQQIDLLHRLQLTLDEIRRAADRWARSQIRRGRSKGLRYSRRLFERTARQWLTFMGRLTLGQPEASPGEAFIDEYVTWMDEECGFSSSTIRERRGRLGHFFAWYSTQGRSLSQISVADIDRYTATECRRWSRRTLATTLDGLRAFFRYAESRGWCTASIADAIETPRIYQHENIPLGPSWADVKRLLASTQTNRSQDIRDRGILLLLAVYGLRAGEVARLCLEDFDWQEELLHVPRSKQRQKVTYPLVRSVGDAVIRYLKKIRPPCHRREVFLTLNAPIRSLSVPGVSSMVYRRMSALGIQAPHRSAHALRHACATRLVSQGLSFKEIGDHLGHRSPITTRVYAKVDLTGLRQVAAFDLGGLS
ncbi:MAG: tyrosine-type recombinase/integrase [Anaerolineae bacterium]